MMTHETRLSYEEKFEAMNALADAVLKMRQPGDWYVDHNVEIKNGSILTSVLAVAQPTPEAAIHAHWDRLTNLKPGEYIVINASNKERRRAVTWNGYMWVHKFEG